MSGAVTVVLAWTCESRVWDGRPFRADQGALPGMRVVREPKACVWINEGSQTDVDSAKAYAAKESAKREQDESERVVFTFPSSEPDPIGRAKRSVLHADPLPVPR